MSVEQKASYLSILGEIDLESFGIVLKAQRVHSKEDVLAIDSFSLFLVAFFRCCDQSALLSQPIKHINAKIKTTYPRL